ncbi:MAG: aminoacyl-tRNA hydrolase [Acidobacteria bacterium]|nr:aminoacyl-tRNA hydrolase [Acidobacteriota bacterium]
MKAIFGLGNPGPRYAGTRHNVGFAVVDELARRAGIAFESAPADALVARWRRNDIASGPDVVQGAEDVARGFSRAAVALLVKPLTFMNESGQAVGELARYFKIDVPDLLIVVDEVQLPLGKIRARARGSAGGHNGLKSVIAHLGDEFPRLRVGVGRGDGRRDLVDHVLSRFEPDERDEVERMTLRTADAAETFLTSGIAAVMNAYNGGDPATTE